MRIKVKYLHESSWGCVVPQLGGLQIVEDFQSVRISESPSSFVAGDIDGGEKVLVC